jgi:hypothetical protein
MLPIVPVAAGEPAGTDAMRLAEEVAPDDEVGLGDDRCSRETNIPARRTKQAARPKYSATLFFVPMAQSYPRGGPDALRTPTARPSGRSGSSLPNEFQSDVHCRRGEFLGSSLEAH